MFMRTRNLRNIFKCHRVFVTSASIGSIIICIGVMLLCDGVFRLNHILSIIISIVISVLVNLCALRALDRALVSMYNDELQKDTIRLTEMLVTGDLIKEEPYKKLLYQLVECENELSKKHNNE